MELLMIFMIFNMMLTFMLIITVISMANRIDNKLDEKLKNKVELPPLDEPMKLSKQEAEVLQSLADMLSFNGNLPDKE